MPPPVSASIRQKSTLGLHESAKAPAFWVWSPLAGQSSLSRQGTHPLAALIMVPSTLMTTTIRFTIITPENPDSWAAIQTNTNQSITQPVKKDRAVGLSLMGVMG